MFVEVSTIIQAPIEDVWPWLDDFANWHRWLPVLTSSTMEDGLDQGPVGSVRVLGLPDGNTTLERLLSSDAVNHSLTYTFHGPTAFPLRKYVSTVRLAPITTDGTTFGHWTCVIDADAADEAELTQTFEGAYGFFFQSLKNVAEKAS
jgi:hypothetical protein